jgi:hypothetical protein
MFAIQSVIKVLTTTTTAGFTNQELLDYICFDYQIKREK